MTHTQGNWIVQDALIKENHNLKIKTANLLSVNAGGMIIALCGVKNNEVVQANAKLIAAAPELLSACFMAREELVLGGDWANAKGIIDKAIKKATNE